jgi:hypothetical protein
MRGKEAGSLYARLWPIPNNFSRHHPRKRLIGILWTLWLIAKPRRTGTCFRLAEGEITARRDTICPDVAPMVIVSRNGKVNRIPKNP